VFVACLGAFRYATRRDLSSWARALLWALVALLVFGLVGVLVSIPHANAICSAAGTSGHHPRRVAARRETVNVKTNYTNPRSVMSSTDLRSEASILAPEAVGSARDADREAFQHDIARITRIRRCVVT
jgi:hypothetical protein